MQLSKVVYDLFTNTGWNRSLAVRPMCRGCRFDKCVAVGLNYGEKMRAQKEVPKVRLHVSKQKQALF